MMQTDPLPARVQHFLDHDRLPSVGGRCLSDDEDIDHAHRFRAPKLSGPVGRPKQPTARCHQVLPIAALIRCTTLTPTPAVLAVFTIPVPLERRRRTARSLSTGSGGRPRRLPWARALARPALTRSTIIARSNSAKTPN